MMKPLVKILKTVDKTKEITAGLDALLGFDVKVGIPEAKTERDDPEEDLTNAQLGFVLSEGVGTRSRQQEIASLVGQGLTYSAAVSAFLTENGDPSLAIPPRPFLEPSIRHYMPVILKQQTKIINLALSGKKDKIKAEFGKLGLLGQNIVKGWFTDSSNGWPPNAESTIARKGSDRPMIDTGQLRNSISYIVEEK